MLRGLRGSAALALLVLFFAAGLIMTTAIPARADLPPGCHLARDDQGNLYVECDKGDGGTTTTTDPTTAAPSTDGSGGSGDSDGPPDQPTSYPTYDEVQCISKPEPAPPPAGATVAGTKVAGSVVMLCPSGIDGGPPFYFWSTPAAPPPPVDLAALSRNARARIPIPQFTLRFGPDAKRLAVNMNTTFTAVPDRSTNLSASASDRGITVTVTGRLASMAWLPGEAVQCTPGDRTSPCTGGQVGSVDCAGTSCEYTYRWMSSSARTGGAAVWTVTATATWQFGYTTTGGGATTGPTTATWTETMPAGTGTVSMGEWSTVGGFGE